MDSIIDFLRRFAAQVGADDRERLLADIENIASWKLSDDNSRIEIELKGYRHPPYKGHSSFAIEARIHDQDGSELSAFVNQDEQLRLMEIEIVRLSPGDIIAPVWINPVFRAVKILE